jgi:hypothetical protein
MNKIMRHIILSNGMHLLHLKDEDECEIKVMILTEEEYQHFTWWSRVKININQLIK